MPHIENFLKTLNDRYLPGEPMTKEWLLFYGDYVANSAPELHKRAQKAADTHCAAWPEALRTRSQVVSAFDIAWFQSLENNNDT